ncbi:hypothetical protein [Desertivirga brevis]|uniref:hypothetical protein n=1 Tax=Desertivirga brevis TaxID=2810310 RepID=UPI001A956944|nr:hypothetical protein [Pedobacter sp. SYSU D00873]
MNAIRIKDDLNHYTRYVGAVIFLMFINLTTFAQRVNAEDDENRSNNNKATTEFNYDTRETPWYLQPWVWALVAAVVILFIAWATKGSMKRNIENDSETGTAH